MSRLFTVLQTGLCTLSLLLGGCKSPSTAELQRFRFEEPQMGVPFSITLYAPDAVLARKAATAAFARVAELNQIMSDYETDSEISLLSRSSEQGSPAVKLSPDLWFVLSAARKLSRESGGAFDITIGPCSSLWRKARREKELPDSARQQSALGKVGYRNLLLDENTRSARLLKQGMRLDLGAIAKGYAADEALKVLKQHRISRALIAASGDLAIGDAPPGKSGWLVELAAPDLPGAQAATLTLDNCGVATSGDLFQRLEINGVRYSHILDPFTCIGMTNRALATVVAPNCMLADAIDTTLTLLSAEEARKLVRRYGVAARVIRVENDKPLEFQNAKFERLLQKRI